MPAPITILEPDPGPLTPSWRAFLELGFRPLYLAGASWACIAAMIWIFTPNWVNGPLGGLAWHAHEMLWGFIATIAVGFLLTASANWTGQVPMSGVPLGGLLMSWIVARAGYLLDHEAAWWIAACAETLFFTAAAAAIGRVIWRTRNRRNYGVPLMLLGLALANGLFLATLDDWSRTLRGFHAGLLVMALIALLVARRVIPFFAMRAVPDLRIPLHEHTGLAQIIAVAVALAALLADWPWLLATGLTIAGACALWQCFAWRPAAVRTRPILWILYVGYAGLGLGLLTAAGQAAGFTIRTALPVHLIGMAGFAVLIIGMLTRTALGHLGRGLMLDRSMIASYWLVIAATALRLAALWPSAFSGWLLDAAAITWTAAFGTYLWRFTPWMIRPRPDRPLTKPDSSPNRDK